MFMIRNDKSTSKYFDNPPHTQRLVYFESLYPDQLPIFNSHWRDFCVFRFTIDLKKTIQYAEISDNIFVPLGQSPAPLLLRPSHSPTSPPTKSFPFHLDSTESELLVLFHIAYRVIDRKNEDVGKISPGKSDQLVGYGHFFLTGLR